MFDFSDAFELLVLSPLSKRSFSVDMIRLEVIVARYLTIFQNRSP